MKKLFAITLALLTALFCITAIADEPALDDDELEIVVPESEERYVASVTINSTGDGLKVGEYQLLTNELDLTGLYYVAKDMNGTDKVLDYVPGEYSDRANLGSMVEITHTSGNYEMFKMKNTTDWIPGTWTGEGLTTSIRDYRYEVFKYHLIPYGRITADYAEKFYLYTNDKTETLALYETNFGQDSDVYKKIVEYYGTLDADGMAAAVVDIKNYAKSRLESNIVYYAFDENEIIPVNEMKTYKFTSYKQQGAFNSTSNIYAKAIFYVANTDGTVTTHTWTSEAFKFGGGVKHTIDVQAIEGLPEEGWIIGIELRPFAVVEDASLFTVKTSTMTSTNQGLRFLATQFMPAIYPTEYVITEQAETPELAYDYVDGKFVITITNASADTTYKYKSETSGWSTVAAGESSFNVTTTGYWFVKAVGGENANDSVIAKIKIDNVKPQPTLKLGEGYTLTAPEGDVYEIAKLEFNKEPSYQALTTATLTAGVWAVRKAADGILDASIPQYFYVEGAKAGTAVFATATGRDFVKNRWTGVLRNPTLFDFWYVWKNAANKTAYGNTNIEIYHQLTKTEFTNKTYSAYGYKYLFSDDEIVPVSALNDITVKGINNNSYYYNDANGTKTRIEKGKTLARVHVLGADVPYYDVLTDATFHTSLSMELSQLSDKKGYVVAIEYYPIYELYDAEGNKVTDPYMDSDISYAIRFAPLKIVDESVVLNTTGYGHAGVDANGNHKFELILATKAETPTLAVESKNGKYIIKVTNAIEGAIYQYKSAASGWITLDKGETSFEVDDAGTYSVKSTATGKYLGSDVATIVFEGVKETPNLIPDENGVITAPEGETYQYAKLGYGVTPEYTTFTTTTLTPGLWAVKVLGNGTTVFDSDAQIIYVMGDGTGTVGFGANIGTTTAVAGLWTGTKTGAQLFDWDYYSNADKIFTTDHIEIYANFAKTALEDKTFRDYGYKYILKDSEIVPLSELIDLSAKIRNSTTITMNGAAVNYARTRARVHVVGGDVAYYDVYTDCNFTSAPGFVFDLSSLNDKKGYVTAIELYLFDEYLAADGTVLAGPFTTNTVNTSYGITFANLILHEEIELASKAINNSGLSADGKCRYSIRIANDQRSPKFEALETNPNGIRITNYIQGEKYAYATSTNGPWTEFDGDTVEFTAFGEYYIKLVANDDHEDIINLVPFKTSGIMVEGTSLVLDGAIGVKVYFGADADYTASYKVMNKTTNEVILSNDDVEVETVDGKLTFTIPVYPKDASVAKVIATVKNDEDGKEVTIETSIPEYIETLKDMAEDGDRECIDALGVVEAIEGYALYAKNYFNKANEDALPDVTANVEGVDSANIIDNLAGAKYHGTSLILDEDTTLRHYFDVTDSVAFATYTAYVNEEVVYPTILTDNNGTTFAYYEIKDIPAHKLGNKYTLEIYGAENTIAAKVTYSVTNYITKQINSEDTRLANLMKTLYNYYEASDEYAPIAQNKGQRAEIWAAMTLAKETTPAWKEVPAYAPTKDGYTHIKAITYDGFEYKGGKTKIFAYVGFPEGATADSPVPAIVLVHGGGGHPYAHWVKLWNDRGYAAIAMETTGYFPASGTVTYTESENSNFVYGISGDFVEEGYVSAPSRSYPTSYTPVADQWAYHGLSQVILASNILRADERVDSDNIGITGVSWGGTMTSQVIGYDNRFSFAIPVYGTAYLGNEMHTFSNFNNAYVNSLWAAERNLDNAKMPIFWYAYNDDNNFCVPAYYMSYQHTAPFNDKTSLLMLGNWSHSHGSVFNKKHSFWFADWVTYGKNGLVTFADQPKGKVVNCNINIPDDLEGDITAKVHYITEPMTYSTFDKHGWGSYKFLTPYWQTNTTCLTVDKETGRVSGTIPADAAGFYINLVYTIEGTSCETSSIYIPVDNESTPENEADWTWK
ncbi:MAG: hypothetical protein E7613_01850 [Ruminococcaceae bacterium]|nr:hypothetical protein [Oscillospiraceae bacterium]